MIVSQARMDANRKNAQLSCGPKTLEGKMKSRGNGLKHGLCASVVVVEDLALIQQRSREYFDTLKPQNEVHVWMVAQRIERRVRDKISLRAELTWDDDRRFEVEVTARSLSKDPSGTTCALRRTLHGCEWMISRWALLAYAGDTQPEGWTVDQKKLAFDLLATPLQFREGTQPGVMLDDEGRLIDAPYDPSSIARRQIALLKSSRDIVGDLDEAERALAASDLTNEGDPELRRLRRYESMLHTRLRWCIKQVDIQSPYRCPDPTLRPVWIADPETDLKPEPKTEDEIAVEKWLPTNGHPPFDLTPDEYPPLGQNADIPAIIVGRRLKQVLKVEASETTSGDREAPSLIKSGEGLVISYASTLILGRGSFWHAPGVKSCLVWDVWVNWVEALAVIFLERLGEGRSVKSVYISYVSYIT
jgi:hypothetical protein